MSPPVLACLRMTESREVLTHCDRMLNFCMQDSTAALQIAQKQREQGFLPKTISLWAVSNPLRDSPDSVLQKVTAPGH